LIGDAFALPEKIIAAVSALSGEGSPRLRMSSFDSILIRPRESMPHLIEPSWAASLSSSDQYQLRLTRAELTAARRAAHSLALGLDLHDSESAVF
jgi:hypothetical protein